MKKMIHTLTWQFQEVRFVTEDQVVVGDKVEEPDVQLLCIVALRVQKQRETYIK